MRGPDAPVKLGVAGAGYWGINHVRAFSRQPGCRAGGASAIPTPRRSIAPRSSPRMPAATPALDELLADRDVDAVVLATPAVAHAAQALAALAAGKHVFVEKPMALIDRRRRDAWSPPPPGAKQDPHGRPPHALPPGLRATARSWCDGGEIGEVYYLYAAARQPRPPAPRRERALVARRRTTCR